MRRWRAVACGLVLLSWAALVGAATPTQAPQPRVRVSLAEGESLWVGQRLELAIELLAPGYFASGVDFDLPDPDGVLIMPPAARPVIGNETIDGTLYTVQRHTLTVWPMRAGGQTVPPLTARFRFKREPLDTGAVAAAVTTAAIPFAVQVPPGAERLGTVISARNLEVRERWDPEPGSDAIRAGAAFERTVTFTAPGLPGMVLPPFPAGAIDGLGIYPKRELLDQANRGSLTGIRRDRITYVCEEPGRFSIPAVRFTWFDLDAGRLRIETFAGRTLQVIANPDMASGAPAAAAPVVAPAWRTWRALAVALLVVLAALAAARSGRLRRGVGRLIAPLRPVHLVPLNPGNPPG